jgi:hypothetical protein
MLAVCWRFLRSCSSRFSSVALAGVGAFTVATPSGATVTSLYDQVIIVADPQSADLCYSTVPVLGDFGIASGLMMQATFSAYRVPHVPAAGEPPYVDINVVATSPPMVPSFVDDGFDEATKTHMLRMKLDVSDLAASAGANEDGRRRVVQAAKLGLLAMTENMRKLSNGRYRLWVEIEGLPDQADLSGTPLHAKTKRPYSASSPLLAAYSTELINRHGSCG